MALAATHIRFALDLKNRFRVVDTQKYISGTLYPDSRYVTGIDRAVTHPKDELEALIRGENDFKKGWYAHLLCDRVQFEVTKELVPSAFVGERGQGSETWVKRSALKVLQDILDAKEFDLRSNLLYLSYAENPNGEDITKVKFYNDIFKNVYVSLPDVTIEEECEMWKQFGVGDELVVAIRRTSEEYEKTAAVRDAISMMYERMVTEANIEPILKEIR